LPGGAKPHRLIVQFPVYESHRTSGLIVEVEEFEFVEYDEIPVAIGGLPAPQDL